MSTINAPSSLDSWMGPHVQGTVDANAGGPAQDLPTVATPVSGAAYPLFLIWREKMILPY